jgi:tight adherence protein C
MMGDMSFIIWVASFLGVTFFIYGILHYAGNRKIVKDRFKKTAAASTALQPRAENRMKSFLDWISSFGQFGMKDTAETSKLRSTLIQAGYRHPKNTAIYYGIQALGALLLPMPYLLANLVHGRMAAGNLTGLILLAGLGFYTPKLFLYFKVNGRQDRIDRALPDVLDLLIVCVEAGLSLQATLNRITDEVRLISKDMYDELHLTNLELRTGITRETALKSLGERTGVQSVKALVGMMIQSERMGTSVSQALRVHSDFLRVQRTQKAEEAAAKLSVKILFPMFLFIFPAVFCVVLGPAIINLMTNSAMKNMLSH